MVLNDHCTTVLTYLKNQLVTRLYQLLLVIAQAETLKVHPESQSFPTSLQVALNSCRGKCRTSSSSVEKLLSYQVL